MQDGSKTPKRDSARRAHAEPALLLGSTLSLLFLPLSLDSQTLNFQGLISGWTALSGEKGTPSQLGFCWLPGLTLVRPLHGARFIDTEFSLNAWGTADVYRIDDLQTDGKVKLYRGQARFSSTRFEARLGLQKISFGSAAFLRPLMWFDRLDPRDPLQLTDGVYGLLLRFYFLTNANIWLWGLYGNKDPKGWELLPTATRRPEFGGRLQTPLPKGELAFSYHHRKVKFETERGWSPAWASSAIPENRFGFDGKWDLGVGIWFEAAFIRQEDDRLPSPRQRSFVIGLDYTFDIGNGLHALAEYFEYTSAQDSWNDRDDGAAIRFVALSLAYPLDLLDNLTGIVYYDRENQNAYTFFRWQRTFDRWNFHVMAFWNPERFRIYRTEATGANLFAGKGIQVMVIFHY